MSVPTAQAESLIRPLRREDREPLRLLLVETGVFTEDEISIALELIDAVLDKPGQKDYIIYTYAEQGVPLGYYCIGPTPATEGTFDLYWIAVRPAAHGRGIGRALTAHAEEFIRMRGGRLVIAETSGRPGYRNTREFYLRAGYTELARIRDYYRRDDDLVVFGKYVSQK